jgi:hypothetical protein
MVKCDHVQMRLWIQMNPSPFFPKPIPKNPNPLWDFEGEEED